MGESAGEIMGEALSERGREKGVKEERGISEVNPPPSSVGVQHLQWMMLPWIH